MGKIFKALEKAEKEREEAAGGETSAEAVQRREPTFILPPPGDSPDNPETASLVQLDPLSLEQFRKLKTHLFSHKTDGAPRTLMVTSANTGEGKTMVAVNLAVMIALELNAYALLVDCDFRRPSLASLFGLDGKKGLTNYLMRDENLPDLIMKTSIDKLSVIPSGQVPDNPVELIGSRKMAALTSELKSRYEDRYIIFDSSPLLMTTEPGVLQQMVDGIIVVVRAGVTPRDLLQQAMRQLLQDKILGVVLNGLEFNSTSLQARYFGSDSYGYYSYYGAHRKPEKPQSRWRRLIPHRRPKGTVKDKGL